MALPAESRPRPHYLQRGDRPAGHPARPEQAAGQVLQAVGPVVVVAAHTLRAWVAVRAAGRGLGGGGKGRVRALGGP